MAIIFTTGFALIALTTAASSLAAVPAPSAVQLTQEAKGLIDQYFGDQSVLERAAALLNQAATVDDHDANVYVQAARLTIKAGQLVGEQYRPGSVEECEALLKRALEIDPNVAQAHVLMADVFDLRHDYTQEKTELDLARQFDPADRWALLGLARHARHLKQTTVSYRYLQKVREMGPGSAVDDRNAYISSLYYLSRISRVGEPSQLPVLAAIARKERNPNDVWTLGNFAWEFFRKGMFDDALDYAREALQARSFGQARLTLVTALYGKAARLTLDGDASSARPLVTEAASFGFARSQVLERFSLGMPMVQSLVPTVEGLIVDPPLPSGVPRS